MDYGWRSYDAAGRFFNQDRFAEKYLNFSPYHYAANNPILYIDVNGESLDIPMTGQRFLNSVNDLMSPLEGTRVGISMTNGNVSLNYGDISAEEIASGQENEEVLLLNDIIRADENYLNEASRKETAKDREKGEILESEENQNLGPGYMIRNLSQTERNIDGGIVGLDFTVAKQKRLLKMHVLRNNSYEKN